jgi:hypothetical protein
VRELCEERPDPTGSASDHDALTGGHVRLVDQRLPGRQSGQYRSGCIDVGDRLPLTGDARHRNDDELSRRPVAIERNEPEHRVPDDQLGHIRADFDDHPCEFM